MARHDFIPTFMTSDTHHFHKKAVKFRPKFSTLEEMSQYYEDRHNDVVKNPKSWVYHHGDMGFAKRPLKLTGKIILIRGNHDSRDFVNYLLKEGIIVACVDQMVKRLHGSTFMMSHKPDPYWRRRVDLPDLICTHGHLHGGTHHDDEFGWVRDEPNYIDVGVDCKWTKGAPVSVDEVIQRAHDRILDFSS